MIEEPDGSERAHPASGCVPERDADEGREHHVRERRHETADEEDHEHVAGEAAGVEQFRSEVEDVLGEREPARDPRRVDESVDRAVEVLACRPEQDEQAEALATLLDERRLHDAARGSPSSPRRVRRRSARCRTPCRTAVRSRPTTAAPHRNAKTTATRGSGSHRSTQRTPKNTIASGTSAMMPPRATASAPRMLSRNTTTPRATTDTSTMPMMPSASRLELRRGGCASTGCVGVAVEATTAAGAWAGAAACCPADAVWSVVEAVGSLEVMRSP